MNESEMISFVLEEYFPDLIITVDCGISAVKEVEELKDLGVDVIVTDHHELPEKLPDCVIVNPKLQDDYPYDNLCGAGVAFKVACALIGERAYQYLDFATLATVADSVPLLGENRDIVTEGLKAFNNNLRPCFAALIGKTYDGITAQTLAFNIAPRVNAAGRMGDAQAAFRLFISQDETEIYDLAVKLCAYNTEDGIILYLDPFFPAVVGNVPLIFKLGRSLRRNRNGAFIIYGMVRIILTADLRIGYLGNHAARLLQDKNYLLRVEAADGTDTVVIKGMLGLIRNMRALAAEATGPPMIGLVHIKGILRRRGMRTSVAMIVFDMRLYIAVADTSVVAITALGFKAGLAASFTQQNTCKLTVCANITIVETFAAVLTEMEIVIAVLYTDGRRFGAVGIALAAVKAKLAKVALVYHTVRGTAIGTEMLVPFGVFDTVLAALTALGVSVVLTAEYAQTTVVAKLNAVLEQAFLTLLTDNTAFLTVIVSKVTLCIRSVAVAALLAVHIFDFPAYLAETATVAKTTHTVSTEPTVTAQFIF